MIGILLFFLNSTSVAAASYYVNPSGSDTNTGLSTSAQFKTISKGLSVLVAGDTLYVSGNYSSGFVISKSGTQSQRINIVGVGNPVITATSSTFGIDLNGNYLTVSGFNVVGGVSAGIYTDNQHNEILNNSIINSVTENGTGPCLNNAWGSALKLRIGADDVKIIGNSVKQSCGEGMGITRASNVDIENNIVNDNFSVNIYIDNSFNVIVKNNTTSCSLSTYYRSGSPARGIMIATENYAGWGSQLHDVLVDHNFIDGCLPIIFYDQVGGTPVNVTITNNVFHNVSTPYVNVPGATTGNNVSGTGLGTPAPVTPSPAPTATAVPVYNEADMEPDGDVDGSDYNTLVSNFNLTGILGWIRSDIIKNGIVDIFDFNRLITNFGK